MIIYRKAAVFQTVAIYCNKIKVVPILENRDCSACLLPPAIPAYTSSVPVTSPWAGALSPPGVGHYSTPWSDCSSQWFPPSWFSLMSLSYTSMTRFNPLEVLVFHECQTVLAVHKYNSWSIHSTLALNWYSWSWARNLHAGLPSVWC